MKASLRFKITNELKKTDYKRLTEFLKEKSSVSVELSSLVDLEFLSVSPITVALEGFGYRIDTRTSFAEAIGFEVCDNLGLENEVDVNLLINRRDFRLSKTVTEPADLERDLNLILSKVERIVNNVCLMYDKQVEKVVKLNSNFLDGQLGMLLKEEELEKRGEITGPFGIIHAKGAKDARERAGGYIPLYKEYDKMYLYDAKRVYFLLPHDFVSTLLCCDDTTMVREEEFDERGKEVLRDLTTKKYLRKHEMRDGTICYFELNEKTRRYLKKNLEHKTPRR